MNIKTLDQTREGRVTVQIEAPSSFFDDRTTVTITVPVTGGVPGYDPEKAVEVMTENYQRARQRVTELEVQLAGNAGTITALEEKVADLEQGRDDDHEQIMELRRQRKIETDRANLAEIERSTVQAALRKSNEELARRFTRDQVQAAKEDARADERASWGRQLDTVKRLRDQMTDRMMAIRSLVDRPEVDDHRPSGDNTDGVVLYRVIEEIRDELNQPAT